MYEIFKLTLSILSEWGMDDNEVMNGGCDQVVASQSQPVL